MHLEVTSAADFISNLLRITKPSPKHQLNDIQLEQFKGSLESLLVLRYRSHWYPDVPTKGSAYRCIRINGKMDPIVEEAGIAVGLAPLALRKLLPAELTLWIDPEQVSYRIGENGSICVLYETEISNRTSPSTESLDSAGSAAISDDFSDKRSDSRAGDLKQMDDYFNSPTKMSHHHQHTPAKFNHFDGYGSPEPGSPTNRYDPRTNMYMNQLSGIERHLYQWNSNHVSF